MSVFGEDDGGNRKGKWAHFIALAYGLSGVEMDPLMLLIHMAFGFSNFLNSRLFIYFLVDTHKPK